MTAEYSIHLLLLKLLGGSDCGRVISLLKLTLANQLPRLLSFLAEVFVDIWNKVGSSISLLG